jgi:hypothetical protein
MQVTSDSFRLNQCPLAADLLRQASSFIENSSSPSVSSGGCATTWTFYRPSYFRLTAPQPLRRPHNTTLVRLSRRCPTTCLGLHATPDSFRLSQRPLAATIPAPGSHRPSVFPSVFSPFRNILECPFRTSRFSSRLRRGLGPWTGFTPSRVAY